MSITSPLPLTQYTGQISTDSVLLETCKGFCLGCNMMGEPKSKAMPVSPRAVATRDLLGEWVTDTSPVFIFITLNGWSGCWMLYTLLRIQQWDYNHNGIFFSHLKNNYRNRYM